MYKITKQYGRGSETNVGTLADVNDATMLIEAKLEADSRMNIKVTYCLYEGMDLMKKFDPIEAGASASGSESRGSASSFSPTPFNTAPRPPGTPPKWNKDGDEGKN